jgi:hypothetical protein
MSYGPFSLLKSLVVGLILGSLVFIALAGLIGGAENDQQMRTWLYTVGAGLALTLTLTVALNYVIGRRVQQQIEHSRKRFSGSQMRAPEGGRGTSRFILAPDKEHSPPEPSTSSRNSRHLEGQH